MKAHSLPVLYLLLYNKPQRSEIRRTPHSNNMTLFHSTFKFFRRCLFKHEVGEADKAGTPLQGQDGNTKLERNTGTTAESDPGNDINTQIQSYAAEKLSWNSIMCRISLVEYEDCARHMASTHKRDEHQDQATSGVTISGGLGQTTVVEIAVHAPYRDGSYYNNLALLLAGYPLPLASAIAICYGD